MRQLRATLWRPIDLGSMGQKYSLSRRLFILNVGVPAASPLGILGQDRAIGVRRVSLLLPSSAGGVTPLIEAFCATVNSVFRMGTW